MKIINSYYGFSDVGLIQHYENTRDNEILYHGVTLNEKDVMQALTNLFLETPEQKLRPGRSDLNFYAPNGDFAKWLRKNPSALYMTICNQITEKYANNPAQYVCAEWEWANYKYSQLAYQQICNRFPYYTSRFHKLNNSEAENALPLIEAFNSTFEPTSLEGFFTDYQVVREPVDLEEELV